MIGHYLLTLTQEQEDRVLTQRLQSCAVSELDYQARGGCLLQTVDGVHVGSEIKRENAHYCDRPRTALPYYLSHHVGLAYDGLISRFDTERVNAAIRNRILSNRARRALRNAPQLTVAV